MNQGLKGKVALVTGGSRGIGKAISLKLAEAGAKVLVNYRSNREAAEETLSAVQEHSTESKLISFDISDFQATEEAISAEPQIDILIANAAISRDALIPRSSMEHFQEVLHTNLLGNINLVRVLARSMMRQRYGRICCIGSIIGEMGNKGQSAYAASKSGLFGFAKSVARELASRNVTCNVVAPGFIETEMTGALPEEVRKQYLEQIPVGRFGAVEDVASSVCFLVSDQASYITGATLDVNGGLLMR